MDANTTSLSSSSLSQAHLSQRCYDLVFLFSQLQDEPVQSTCFAKGITTGRRIDFVFVNSPAVLSINQFYLQNDISMPIYHLFSRLLWTFSQNGLSVWPYHLPIMTYLSQLLTFSKPFTLFSSGISIIFTLTLTSLIINGPNGLNNT